jgi:hypothetical protein
MKGSILCLFGLALLALPGPAGATLVLYSNLANAFPSGSVAISSTRYAGASFTTDNNSYTLADVIVSLEGISGGQGVNISLYSSTAGAPNANISPLGFVNDNVLSTSSFTQEMVSGANLALTANTLYYIVLSGLSSTQNDANWESATTAAGSGITGSVTPSMALSGNSGATWSTNTVNVDHKPFVLQVDVNSTTPEPGTLFGALAGLGLVVLGRMRRK